MIDCSASIGGSNNMSFQSGQFLSEIVRILNVARNFLAGMNENVHTERLSNREMYSLGHGGLEECIFDFSDIPHSQYTQFFAQLPNFFTKSCYSIAFTQDLADKLKSLPKSKREKYKNDFKVLSASILQQRPHYSRYLIKIIKSTIARNKTTTHLKFSSIDVQEDDIHALFDCIPRSPILREIELHHIHIKDEDFAAFLVTITPYQYSTMVFCDCGLTSKVLPIVSRFLSTQPENPTEEWSLTLFDLSGNDFTEEEFQYFDGVLDARSQGLAKLPVMPDPLGVSITWSSDDGGLNLNNLLENTQKVLMEVHYEENRKLRTELAELMARLEVVKVDDETFLVGPDAADIAAAERSIKQAVDKMEALPTP